ncbi:MAG: NADPH-dependent glutamate synthase [Deltaproteobacteria bacterium]|nr:MAG: NADPH-dependent glutamate synthase [Deltaproteobacteria bacterium]
MHPILRRDLLGPQTFLWEMLAPDVARAARPGHFVMLRLHEGGERIPLTVADMDPDKGTITMVIQALGKTTRKMMNDYDAGDSVADFVGPLGMQQHVSRVGHVALVGGGAGIAPIFPQLRAFKEAGNRTTGIIGFRSRSQVFWEDKLGPFCDELVVCTDDGSQGRKGLVTEALYDLVRRDRPDLVVAIGPLPMMRACADVTRPLGIRTMVSLNTIMVDGTGMCGSCRATVGGEIKFACVDGPDFDGHLVDFGELLSRQKRFKAQESRASDDYAHICKVERQLFREEKRNYKKIKELQPRQTPMPERPAAARARTFEEVNLGYSLADALLEAERCIQCAKPTCIAGCPVAIDIPRFIRHLLVRDLDGALEVIHEASLFPSICGRVCPQEIQCEAQCIIGKKVEPVAIGRLERFVGDHARARRVRASAPPRSLGKVAICGSGPSGLAAAADLVRHGAEVTLFEALHVAGGVLRYGIPAFRLPREIIDREVKAVEEMGVRFETNKVIGKTFTVPQLLSEKGFDAVFLGVGAGAPAFLGIPGESAGQVYSANEFLTRVNLMGGDRFPYRDTPLTVGKSVVVIGAGNTAMDCLRVAKRLGAPAVRCVYRRSDAEAPARAEELRHAKEEGIEFFFLHAPAAILVGEDEYVRGIRLQKMALGEPDAKGRRKPVPTGEVIDLDCDMVIYALGTKANPIVTRATPGLGLDARGNIVADDGGTQATTLPGVFAGGVIVTGGATVILAMGAGRRAARAIAAYLESGKKWPVTREQAEAFVPATPHDTGSKALTCPKCRRPVEADEEYVCCAGASIRWRCEGCAKVSEGFAFPHGMCPRCGGRLQAEEEPAAVAGTGEMEAIRGAFEIELGGMAFYVRAAEEAKDADLKKLFQRFSAMEREHMALLTSRYHIEPFGPGTVTHIDQTAIYGPGILSVPDDAASVFRTAIAFEQRAADFFTARETRFPEGSAARKLYRELAEEEREHVDMLRTEYARFRQGKPGLL